MDLLGSPEVARRVVVLAADRSYRFSHINSVLARTPRQEVALSPMTLDELLQLLHRFNDMGLAADSVALRQPEIGSNDWSAKSRQWQFVAS